MTQDDPATQRDLAFLDRRRFLQSSTQAMLATLLGAELALDALAAEPWARASENTSRGITRVGLRSERLDALATFYGQTLGFPVEQTPGRLEVQAGGTLLVFTPPADESLADETATESTPIYHVAWAIPSNKLALGKAWLRQRTPLLVHPDGRDEFHFRSVRRRAVYFADPAGNILELIARESLGDTALGPFSLADLLYVNHVGLVVRSVEQAVRTLEQALKLRPTQPPTPNFATVGDAHRHLVLVSQGRLWLPEMTRAAQVFDTEVTLHDATRQTYDIDGYPYRIAIEF